MRIRVDLRLKFRPFVFLFIIRGGKDHYLFAAAIYSLRIEFFIPPIYTLYYGFIKRCEVMK